MSDTTTIMAPREARPTAASPPETAITVTGVSKTYGDGRSAVLALDDVSVDIAAGEFMCLLGASGCGKSTLLNLIAGLYHVTDGTIDTAGRRSALMFQEPALFPWLTAAANVELALTLRGWSRRNARERALDLLARVRLDGFASKRPHELSGGMRQRVALARALAQDADILLMDEPFGALDAMTRDLLHDELERVWSDTGLTVVFVTHNVREAVRLGDRIAVLTSRPGRVARIYDVPLERPRRIESVEVTEITAAVTARLREEVARHGR